MIRCAAADLRRDVGDMRKENCGRWHILAVSAGHTTMTIVPVVWDICRRAFFKVLPVAASIEWFRSRWGG